jgi:hypothetical protein
MINNHIIKTSIFAFFVCALSASIATPWTDAANALYTLSGCMTKECNSKFLKDTAASGRLRFIGQEQANDLIRNSCEVLVAYETRMDKNQIEAMYRQLNERNQKLCQELYEKDQKLCQELPFYSPEMPLQQTARTATKMKENLQHIKTICNEILKGNIPDKMPEITLIHGLNGIGMLLTDGNNEEVTESMKQLGIFPTITEV